MYELEPLTVGETADWHREMRRASLADEVARWGRTFYPRVNAADTPEGVGYEGFRVVRQGVDIGWLGLREERPAAGIGSLHVDSFWVHPPLRGRGVGRQLLAVAESEVRRRHLRLLELAVAAPNEVALRLYRSAGMVTVRQDRLVLADRLPAVDAVRARSVLSLDWRRVAVTRRGRRLGTMSLHRLERGGDIAQGFPLQVRSATDLTAVLTAAARDVVPLGIAALVVTLDTASSAQLSDEDFPVRWHFLAKEV